MAHIAEKNGVVSNGTTPVNTSSAITPKAKLSCLNVTFPSWKNSGAYKKCYQNIFQMKYADNEVINVTLYKMSLVKATDENSASMLSLIELSEGNSNPVTRARLF